MASKSFTLADGPDVGGKAPCSKCCMYSTVLVFIALLTGAGFYFYQTAYVCSYPELDETGLSNWTSGAERIAFGCFPGYFLEGHSDLVVAKCEGGEWNPLPPSCNSLPLRIDCHVNNQSLVGNITMWQETVDSPTFICGLINYTDAVQPQGHVTEHIIISKRTCNISHHIPEHPSELLHPRPHLHPHPSPTPVSSTTAPSPNSTEIESTSPSPSSPSSRTTSSEEEDSESNEDINPIQESGSKLLRIKFNSTSLKAFRKAELFMTIIFIDPKQTATLVSVHQENQTLVMGGSDSAHSINSSWIMDKQAKAFSYADLPYYYRHFE